MNRLSISLSVIALTLTWSALAHAVTWRGAKVCPRYYPRGEIDSMNIDGTVEAKFAFVHGKDRITDEGYGLLGGGLHARLNIYPAEKAFIHLSGNAVAGVVTRGAGNGGPNLGNMDVAFFGDAIVGLSWQKIVETPLKRILRHEVYEGIGTYTSWCAESQLTRRIHGLGIGAKTMFAMSRLDGLESAFAVGPEIGYFFETTGARTGRTLGLAILTNYAVFPVPDSSTILRNFGFEGRMWTGFGRFTMLLDGFYFGRAWFLGISLGYHFTPDGR